MASNADVLAQVPANATRVQVIDEFGHQKYKKPAEVADSDTICKDSAGVPVVMTGTPGRKKRPEFAPANDKVADLLRLKDEHLKDDGLLGTVRENPEAAAVLDHVMVGLAEESASLGFERVEAERSGLPTSQISMRRINALKAVGDAWLKRKDQLSASGVDLESPAFQRLFAYIMDTYKDVLTGLNVRPEMIETIFATFSKKLDDDWTREANRRMAGD